MNEIKTSNQAAQILGLKPQTLRIWRLKGIGPRYIRYGGTNGRVVYRQEDIDEWLESRCFSNTSEETEFGKINADANLK